MRAASLLLLVFLVGALGACGHKKPKEPKEAKSTSTAPAAESKCEVKGFSYSMPEPGPIKDSAAMAVADGGAK